MDEKEVSRERHGLREQLDLLSPPIWHSPTGVLKTVTVYVFVPHATIASRRG